MKLVATFAVTALAGTAAFADGHQDRTGWPESFTVATASQGGTYFAYGSGWANLVAEELGLTGGGEVTGGPGQNMALVHTGDAQFGMTTMGPAAEAIAGLSPIAPGLAMDNACAMFPMYQTPFSVTALTSSGITTIADIPAGARIGFGPAGSTSDTYFPRMMETLGVEFDRRNGSWSDLGGQLQDGLIDVIAFAAGVPVPAVSQLEVQTDVNIIEFTEAEQATIMEAFPAHIPHSKLTRVLFPCGTLRLPTATCLTA
jgi:TRAP transporter TAXI family solute receptor